MSDWDPPPGMRKFNCRRCGHDFAARVPATMCPTCVVYVKRRQKTDPGYSPFDLPGDYRRGALLQIRRSV